MKSIFRMLFFAFAFVGSLLSGATDDTCTSGCTGDVNKTYLTLRSASANLALEYNNGWRDIIYRSTHLPCGSDIQCSFLYESTGRNSSIGRYFSPFKGTDTTRNNCFTFGSRVGTDQTLDETLNLRDFIQLPSTGDDTSDELAANMRLCMQRQAYSFVFNLHQRLDYIVKGLFFKINMPIVHEKHTINGCITGDSITNGGDIFEVTADGIKGALQAYFTGQSVDVELANGSTQGILQQQLTYGIIPCITDCASSGIPPIALPSKSTSGLADIDFQLGYNFLYRPTYNATVALGVTVPTGGEPYATRMWEPIAGNNKHWGIGCNFYGDWRVWSHKNHQVVIESALSYRWLFTNSEKRTLGFCNQSWGQYRLLGQKGQKLLIPAANILTQKMNVEAGSQVDFIFQGHYIWKYLGVDFGYNLYYRDAENLTMRSGCEEFIPSNTYAFPNKEYNPLTVDAAGFGLLDNNQQNSADFEDPANPRYLNCTDIDKKAGATPSFLSHKIYAGVSYSEPLWKLPVLLGIGAYYEFGSCNQVPNSWGVSAKLAIGF